MTKINPPLRRYQRMQKILIIDDTPNIRLLLRKYLEPAGYEVLEASTGQEGLETFNRHRPPVVILDLMMPVMSGLEFLAQLSPESIQENQFIILSGEADDELIKQSFELGAQVFLQKPVKKEMLLGAVKRGLQSAAYVRQIKELNQHWHTLLQTLPGIVFECDAELKLVFLSERCSKLLGYQPEEMLGRRILDFMDEPHQKEFLLKFTEQLGQQKGHYLLKGHTRLVELTMRDKSGALIPLQMSSNARYDDKGTAISLIGLMEDQRKLTKAKEYMAGIQLETVIEINQNKKIIAAEEGLDQYIPLEPDQQGEFHRPYIMDYMVDKELEHLLDFAFEQREDVPFPIEIEFIDVEGQVCQFKVNFSFDPLRNILQGRATPLATDDGLIILSKQLEHQEEILKRAVVVDQATAKSILKDCNNLIHELLDLLQKLKQFGFIEEDHFNLDEYKEFSQGKKLPDYCDWMRFFGNKLHGLKGLGGFLLPEVKSLCHQLEDYTKPLGNLELVFTQGGHAFLKDFILYVDELLERYASNPEEIPLTQEWHEQITKKTKRAQGMIGEEGAILQDFITERCKDRGQLRRLTEEEDVFISVQKKAYHELASEVEMIYYSLEPHIPPSQRVVNNSRFNKIVELHQRAQLVTLDLSRYDRLVPSLAQEYEKQAEFRLLGQAVKANIEFWNSMHEIFNHTVKNAIIHGLETPPERKSQGKDEIGLVEIKLSENTLSIFVDIRDDGRGMDIEQIKQKTLESGQIPAQVLALMSTSQILQLVFLQGISTADSLDQNAGRGLGLNAVQEVMNRYHGQCEIKSEVGQGSSWHFTFPKTNVSLPSVVIQIGPFILAMPEEMIESFLDFQELEVFSTATHQMIHYNGQPLILIQSEQLFAPWVKADKNNNRQMMILKGMKGEHYGMVINDILFRARLPLQPLRKGMVGKKLFLGGSLFQGKAIMVFDPSALENIETMLSHEEESSQPDQNPEESPETIGAGGDQTIQESPEATGTGEDQTPEENPETMGEGENQAIKETQSP